MKDLNKSALFLNAKESSLVSNLSKALALHFAKDEFFALLIIMLNFRLEECRDVCLKADDKIINSDLAINSFLQTIFASRRDQKLKLDKNDAFFLEETAKILKKSAKKLTEFTIHDLIMKNFDKFNEYLCNAQNLEDKPLVYDVDLKRLYFRRYFDYENDSANFIKNAILENDGDEKELEHKLDLLFYENTVSPDFQRLAVKKSYLNRFSIISGGPGTGKTTTVTKLLILLLADNQNLRIALTAPTGKASARLKESIISQKNFIKNNEKFSANLKELIKNKGITLDDLLDSLPENTTTVHSLLKIIPHKVTPLFNKNRKLPFDVVLVDEVSMLDLSLFHHLQDALYNNCRLILLGDRNQLSSVEAGAVLSEICSYAIENQSKVSFFTELQKGWRCNEEISEMAKLINSEDFLTTYTNLNYKNLLYTKAWPLTTPLFDKKAKTTHSLNNVITWYKDPNYLTTAQIAKDSLAEIKDDPQGSFYTFIKFLKDKTQNGLYGLNTEDVKIAFKYLNYFRILCSNRNGTISQNTLNEIISNKVFSFIYERNRNFEDVFFTGLVVMVTKNNHTLGLANGDVGFCAPDAENNGALRVFFEGDNSSCARKVNPLFLNNCEQGFAMTIHKSQGSEYKTIAIATSLENNPVLTKELIYTGITRARDKVRLYSLENIFKNACNRKISRTGGLKLRLFK